MAKENPTGIKCDPCNLDGTDTTADVFCGDCEENLCNSCAKFHKRSKKLKKHVLITIAEKRSAQFFQEGIAFKCKEHDKKLKYICLDHNSLGCSLCTITNHKNCKDVKSLKEYINTPRCLDDSAQKRNQIHMLSQKCAEMQSHAEKVRQIECIAATLKEFQETISVQANTFRRSRDQRTNIRQSDYSSLQAYVKRLHELLLSFHNDVDGKYVVVLNDFNNKIQPVIALLDTCVKDMSVHMNKIENSLTDTSEKLVASINAIKAELRFSDLSADFPSYFSSRYTCKPKPKKVVMMSKNSVMLDESRQRLIVFDTKLLKTISSWPLPNQPSNFAVVDSNTIAVSFQTERKIKVFKVEDNSLTECHTMELDLPFVGLTFSRHNRINYLYCIRYQPIQIVRATFPGNEIKLFSNIYLNRQMITAVNTQIHAGTTSGLLFISLARANIVIGLTLEGKMKWVLNHPHLRIPMGLAVGPLGNLFVCCYGGQEIAKVDQTGKLQGLCKGGASGGTVLKAPMALDYDASSDNFIVCDDEEGKEIKVFKTGDLLIHAV